MPNKTQLRIVRKGAAAWNEWRQKNPDVAVDLDDADLSELDLNGACFSKAHLNGASFLGANLCKAHFYRSQLAGAIFYGANLKKPILGKPSLWFRGDCFVGESTLLAVTLDEDIKYGRRKTGARHAKPHHRSLPR